MIVPMKKVSLVVLEKEKKQALEKLRKLKLVHVEDLTGNGENLSKLKSTYDMMERAFFLISDIKVKEKDVIQVSLTKEEAVEKASQFLELLSLKKNYEDLITGNTKEIERFSRWGDVDPADLSFPVGGMWIPQTLGSLQKKGIFSSSMKFRQNITP